MSAKFDEDAHKGLVSIMSTRSKCDAQTNVRMNALRDAGTDGNTIALLHVCPLILALCGNNYPYMKILIDDFTNFLPCKNN